MGKEKLHRTVVVGDWQAPYHDVKALEAFFAFLTHFKPDTVILNGDLIDNNALSKYLRHTDIQKGASFKEEVLCVRKLLQRLRKILPRAEILFPFGNHELRLEKYVAANADEFMGLIALEELLHLKELGIKWVKNDLNENWIEHRGVLIGHFSKSNKWSAYTGKNLIDELGRTVVQHHTHKVGMHVRRYFDREVYGIEPGCLADRKAVYAQRTHWSQGFLVLYFDSRNNWWPELVVIKDGAFVANGTLYRL